VQKVGATAQAIHGELTTSEFRKVIKRDKSHYPELKDDKYFDSWNQNFVATVYTHHTQKVLDESYKLKTAAERDLFDQMQFCMYLVLQEKLKSEKGRSLVNDYENT
jgi:hypothetical protein